MQTNLTKWFGFASFTLLILSVVLSFFDVVMPQIWWWALACSFSGSFLIFTVQQRLGLYVIKRLGEATITMFAIASITFLLLRMVPGGPFDSEKSLPAEVLANIEKKYKLNEPIYVQYWDYLVNLAHGDLGNSYKFVGKPVTEILLQTAAPSFELGVYSLLLAYLIGIPAGLFAASRHNTVFDHGAMLGAISGVSLPPFLVGPILILVFCFWWNLLPVAFWNGPAYYILPVITLGVRPAAIIARLTRASVLDVIQSDYIRTARAKGLSERVVLFRHVLKNSLIPVLTFSGPLVAAILSGSFVVEIIFAISGMGPHLVQSVTNRDYPLILGTTLIFAFLLVLCNLIVDLLYSYFDPRIKLA